MATTFNLTTFSTQALHCRPILFHSLNVVKWIYIFVYLLVIHKICVCCQALTESDPTGVLDHYYNGSALIHHVCKLGDVPILQVYKFVI